MSSTPNSAIPSRRHDLDWLRVIAFGILILYHIGMYFVTWDWHVKSRWASDVLEPAMWVVNPWRLPLLFFISGVALRFAMDAAALREFLPRRLFRLGIPLVFGMAVVVVPQAYAELRFKGEIEPGYLEFYRRYLGFDQSFSIIVPTWNHLWYVAYMLVYTLLVAGASPLLRLADRRIAAGMEATFHRPLAGIAALFAVALPFLLYRTTLDPLFPTTHALVDDWANHAHSLTILLVGWFVAKNRGFWNAVRRAWRPALVLAAAGAAALILARLNWAFVRDEEALRAAIGLLRVVYAWSAIVLMLALAQRFLARGGRTLTYLTEAIFPYYILHQTIIVCAGYALAFAAFPMCAEALLLVGATASGCALLHEYVIRRSAVLRPLFGLSSARAASHRGSRAAAREA